jgi:hypothetical protein
MSTAWSLDAALQELMWEIKNKHKRIVAVTAEGAEQLALLEKLIHDTLREEDIEIKFNFLDNNHRQIMLIATHPTWAFVFKLKSDNWEYQEVINTLEEIY